MSLIYGTFAHAEVTCVMESIGHIIGMTISFLSIAAIAYRTYCVVLGKKSLSISTAYKTIIGIYVICITGTLSFGFFSSSYLVSSGTFCFFEWSSYALVIFAWPLAIVCGACMIYWYYHVFQIVRNAESKASTYDKLKIDKLHVTKKIAIRLSVLVALFFVCYAPIMFLSLYELSGLRAKAWQDVLAAVPVLFYWMFAPFAYARTNRRLGIWSVLMCTPDVSTSTHERHTKKTVQLLTNKLVISTESSINDSHERSSNNPNITNIDSPTHHGTSSVTPDLSPREKSLIELTILHDSDSPDSLNYNPFGSSRMEGIQPHKIENENENESDIDLQKTPKKFNFQKNKIKYTK